MDKKQLVFLRLKPKAKALGFNSKELRGIAAKIADNLTLEENASEEEVNTAIDNAIDAVLPYLGFGQSLANRTLDEWKNKHPEDEEDEEGEEGEEGEGNDPKSQKRNKSSKNPQNKGNDDTPKWARGMLQTIQNLTSEINTMKGEKTTNERKLKLEEKLKDTGTFGKRILKSFAKMKFENDDEFEEFMEGVDEDLKAYNQERADAGLETMTNPPGGGKSKKEEEPFTDAEIEAMAASM